MKNKFFEKFCNILSSKKSVDAFESYLEIRDKCNALKRQIEKVQRIKHFRPQYL